ncbi:phospholipase A1 PLIP1, chloroplastic-like [Silene latifolia]|uniref:phospholipase A1 PLIP1, chloroplastic-like n=1 Tax=Silene latifolia TaxID=37657 RepID=UPI003D779CA6
MACYSMNIPTSDIVIAREGILTDNCSLGRSSSRETLGKQATLRRSYSDNYLVNSSSQLRASSCTRSHVLKPSRPFGVFSSQWSSPILLSPVKSQMVGTKPENAVELIVTGDFEDNDTKREEEKNANWIQRLLELRTVWKGRQEKEVTYADKGEHSDCEDGCSVDYCDGVIADRAGFDQESFSRLLVQVAWSEAKRFSKLADLCNMAYRISEIKGHDLLLNNSLHIVTSSLEKKAEAIAVKAKLDKDSTHIQGKNLATLESDSKDSVSKQEHTIRSSVAYEIAASAACHVQCYAQKERYSCTCRDITMHEEICPALRGGCNSERAAQMATSTMTAVVAAWEKEKQEVANELQSLHSSPCEWFICDDPVTHVRYFVIQGSESLASWQANLFFEPTKFEETDALVHRGIYEAAQGMYKQFLPEIQNHISTQGGRAKLQFTGHSLGGSISLLLHIMLIARKTVQPSALLPVVTFGSPFIFCGGEKVLDQLGLQESMLQCIILHRDIVPRAFSCTYPGQVVQVLQHLNSSFRSHPCLNKQKMLYSPVGQTYILQPSEKLSPSHPMLPQGCGLYTFDNTQRATAIIALRTFLNTPHPLETLSYPTAYGSEGTIIRDHESNNYTKAVNSVLKLYKKTAFWKVKKERHLVWPLLTDSPHQPWTQKGNLAERSARKEVLSGV